MRGQVFGRSSRAVEPGLEGGVLAGRDGGGDEHPVAPHHGARMSEAGNRRFPDDARAGRSVPGLGQKRPVSHPGRESPPELRTVRAIVVSGTGLGGDGSDEQAGQRQMQGQSTHGNLRSARAGETTSGCGKTPRGCRRPMTFFRCVNCGNHPPCGRLVVACSPAATRPRRRGTSRKRSASLVSGGIRSEETDVQPIRHRGLPEDRG